ncbi:hypothetical protein IMG5_048910 [Ichthyophthirius multifiliis]|uniref:Uncharacterized protein n=1 Tax=Ichthyophthirius multifiliis TaxID=5932 RepID=G0QMH8_ICHMU|nr:hypothetical protein IMG5_048910 [Ichthyophthirius multifiliis]EGR33574.1 hypothetical protein IMG5_048910 [Ichthyophthirius multifiliis]|eukprot:XP_004037560.1 hypothetical protein IMG5_048910 [Ichthyophthirius multifiliis]
MKLSEFILVVKEHLLSWQMDISNRETKLMRCLTNLFEEIDLNGNEILEWDEFTNYVIEKATVLNNIKTKADEIKQYTKSHTKPQQAINNKLLTHKFNNLLTKLIYIPHIDRLALYEEGSDEIIFMNPENGIINNKTLKVIPKSLFVTTSTVKKDEEGLIHVETKKNFIDLKTMILDILYIPDKKYQILLTSSNDKYVRGWKNTSNGWILACQPDNEEELIEHEFKNEIYCLAWDSLNEILYCGQKNGNIVIWYFKTDTEKDLEKDCAHTEVIMDMIAMPKLQFLATAALDGNLILWDTIINKKKRVYKEHSRGITSLSFNEALILLFSAGFDHNICVWNPYIDNLIYKISGHSSPLLVVKVIEGTSQIVSLDSDGNVRITDIKKFSNVQTFSIETSDEKHKFNPQCLTYIPKPLKLAFCGRTISIYEYDKNYNPNSVDDFVAICCAFVPSQLSFYTPAGNKIKLWNALTGDVKKIFSDITNGEITCFALDNLKRRMLIGDSLGQIGIYNTYNGAMIKSLPKHTAEVTHIVHASSIKTFISAAMDNKINMTVDNDFGENELIRTFELKEVTITSLAFNELSKLIVVATNTGITQFYESDTGKCNGSYSELTQYEEITSLNCIEKIPYMITTTTNGKINFIALPPLLYKFQKVYSFKNDDTESIQKAKKELEDKKEQQQYQLNINIQQPIVSQLTQKKKENPTITNQNISISNSILCNATKRLFVSDDKGFIKCFDISQIIHALEKSYINHQDKSGNRNKSFLSPPSFEGVSSQEVWTQRAHFEMIKSIEYIFDENLLITTAYDKKVKIWDSNTGNLIDQLQQNYDKIEPRPIAFKRSGTEEIYDSNLEERIDLKRKESLRNKRIEDKNIKQTTQTNTNIPVSMTFQAKSSSIAQVDQLDKQQANTNDDIYANFHPNKSEEEEFSPFYYLDKINVQKLQSLKSNPEWKLNINYQKYYEQYEKHINDLKKDVLIKEQQLQEKRQKQGINNRRFKVNTYQNQDEQQNFDSDFRPLLKEEQGLKLDAQTIVKSQTDIRIQDGLQKITNSQVSMVKIDNTKSQKNIQTVTQKNIQPIQEENQAEPFALLGDKKAPVSNLYKKELQSKLLFGNNQQEIKLSQEEVNAAHRLAAALANYDKNDYRSLKFYNIQVKENKKNNQKPQKQSNESNYR